LLTGSLRRIGVGRLIAAVGVAAALTVGSLVTAGGVAGTAEAAGSSEAGWYTQVLTPPTNAASPVLLQDISCAAAGSCVAVGSSNVASTDYTVPYVETLAGGDWTASILPAPIKSGTGPGTGVPAVAAQSATLTGISCTSTSSCVAVGDVQYPPTDTVSDIQRGFADVLSGGVWTPTIFSNQPDGTSQTGNVDTMGGVSCTAADSCVTVGTYVSTEDSQAGFAYSLTASGWDASPTIGLEPDPSNLPASEVLSSVSCTAPTSCVAVGSYLDGTTDVTAPLAESLSGTTWSATLTTNPTGIGKARLLGVSCASGTSCQAVGEYTDPHGDTQALAEAMAGTTWTPATDLESGCSEATPVSCVSGSSLAGVSCTGPADCTAVGTFSELDANGAYLDTQTLVQTLSGSGWAPTVGVDPDTDSYPAFSGVSCPGIGACVAVGNASSSTPVGGIEPFSAAELYYPATQLQVIVPPTAVVGQPVSVTVNAVGAGGVDPTYTGTVHLTSSDPAAVLPVDATLTNGSGAFSVTLNTAGTQTVTATDTVDTTINGTSAGITVAPAVSPPSPPVGLSAHGTASGVSLSWFPSTSNGGSTITGYQVLRGVSPGAESPLAITTSTAFVDRTAAPGVGYYYDVEAVNASGDSLPSNEVSTFTTGNLGGGHRFASTPDGAGYWVTSLTGVVTAYGDAHNYGSVTAGTLNQPIVGMASTPDGGGYWLVASDGGIFAFGDARFHGSLGSLDLNEPIVGMATTRDGGGYWLVASDGGIFAFGDAHFDGSLGSRKLNQPIVAMAPTPNGGGYWLVASDGGIFNFGDAQFAGSLGSMKLNQPIVGMAPTPDGRGYWLVATDGGVFTFGDAGFYGSLGGEPVSNPILGIIPGESGTSYRILNAVGTAVQFPA
jgi:hypothetical protein